jgi:hypothetical protein
MQQFFVFFNSLYVHIANLNDMQLHDLYVYYMTHTHPTQEVIMKLPLQVILRKSMSVSEVAALYPLDFIVTGELGDQIFGSDKCKVIVVV